MSNDVEKLKPISTKTPLLGSISILPCEVTLRSTIHVLKGDSRREDWSDHLQILKSDTWLHIKRYLFITTYHYRIKDRRKKNIKLSGKRTFICTLIFICNNITWQGCCLEFYKQQEENMVNAKYSLLSDSFLAVQDSSITNIVCRSVSRSEPTNNQSLRSIKE